MLMNSTMVRYIFAHVLLCAVMLTCILLIVTGTAQPEVFCFSVDARGNLYVGKPQKIEVYSDGNLVYEINSKTSRTYMFTILEDS